MKLFAIVQEGQRVWLVFHDCQYVYIFGEGWKRLSPLRGVSGLDPDRLPK